MNVRCNIEKNNKQIINIYHPDLFFDRIFIINLDKSIDRWNKLTNELLKKGIFNFERQTGVYLPRKDPSYFLPDSLYSNLEAYGGKFKFDTNYILNCVGTNMAHFEIVKKSIKRGYQRILILEDDVFLTKDFFNKFMKTSVFLNSINNDWHLLYLGYKKSSPSFNPKPVNNYLSIPNSGIRGAYGYALNLPTFDIIKKHHLYRGMEIDAYFEFVLCKYCKVFCLNQPIISHRDGMESTITNINWNKRKF